MNASNKMYTPLLNSVTDIRQKLKPANDIVDSALSDLERTQIKTEDMYIEGINFLDLL